MQVDAFDYELPPSLIAQRPLAERSASRLLVLDRRSGRFADSTISDLPTWLAPGDLMVFNDTKVLPARLFGTKATGGRVEILFERAIDEHRFAAKIRASKSPKPGSILKVADHSLQMMARDDDLFILQSECPVAALLETHGRMPLPPYIERGADAADDDRYQTIYAAQSGAVAAPTAGLHFDQSLMARIDAGGIGCTTLTLHVGAGTFAPVRVAAVEDHRMHSEWFEISETTAAAWRHARRQGKRVCAVGTTSLRAMESAIDADGAMVAQAADTDIFIYPGQKVVSVDALLTNFHLPKSTLLMLVAALAGVDAIKAAYAHAVAQRYRFFSYGDAMLIGDFAL